MDVRAKRKDRVTAPMLAAGADPRARSKAGGAALSIATATGRDAVAARLRGA